jgi:putative redox protein
MTSDVADSMSTMRVEYRTGDRFEIGIRDHSLTVDQPLDAGGEDLGPTPTELFVAGLASCVSFYARRYLRRHKIDATGLVVETSYRLGAKPARVTEVHLSIQVPQELAPARRSGLLAVASHCTVHNSITTAPEIAIALTDALETAASRPG